MFHNDAITFSRNRPAQARLSGHFPRPLRTGSGRRFTSPIKEFAGKIPADRRLPRPPVHRRCLFGGEIVHAKWLMHGRCRRCITMGHRRLRVCRIRSPARVTTRWPSNARRRWTAWKSPPGPTMAKSWACATRLWPSKGAVPPRIHPDRARSRPVEATSSRNTGNDPASRPAARHRAPRNLPLMKMISADAPDHGRRGVAGHDRRHHDRAARQEETIGEIAAAATVMRELATPVRCPTTSHFVDIVGTGGDAALYLQYLVDLGLLLFAAAGQGRQARTQRYRREPGSRRVRRHSAPTSCCRRTGCRMHPGDRFGFLRPPPSRSDEAQRRAPRDGRCGPCSTSSAADQLARRAQR